MPRETKTSRCTLSVNGWKLEWEQVGRRKSVSVFTAPDGTTETLKGETLADCVQLIMARGLAGAVRIKAAFVQSLTEGL